MTERRMQMDYFAVMAVGLALMVMIALSIALTVVSHTARSDEHDILSRQITQLCVAIRQHDPSIACTTVR